MDKVNANPLLVSLFFVARCLVPLMIMLGITYLLKKLGLIYESPKPPPEWNNSNDNQPAEGQGEMAHD